MRPAILLLASAIALPAAARPAHADQALALSRAPTYASLPPSVDTVKMQRLLTEADEASVSGRAQHARRIYRSLAQEQRSANVYAGTALWRLASVQLFDGKTYDAAITLDELAAEASRYGDPTMELRATFEAAVLWNKVRRGDEARRNLERVRRLLQSPAVSDDIKRDIERRIVE